MANYRNPAANRPPQLAAWELTNGLPVFFTNFWAQEICAPVGEAGFLSLVHNREGDSVEIWAHHPMTGESHLRARAQPGAPPAVAETLCENGEEFATGHEDGVVQFWSARDGQPRGRIQAHTNAVDGLRYSPDGRLLLSWTFYPREIKTWDSRSRRLLAINQFPGPVRLVLAFSPDGQECATAGFSSDVRRWDAESLRLRSVLPRQTGTVLQLAWSPDGRTLAAGSSSGRLQFWHAPTGRSLFTMLDFHSSLRSLTGLAFSPDGQWFAACDNDGLLHLWHGPRDVSPDQ
jgi:WD40 repeat protein